MGLVKRQQGVITDEQSYTQISVVDATAIQTCHFVQSIIKSLTMFPLGAFFLLSLSSFLGLKKFLALEFDKYLQYDKNLQSFLYGNFVQQKFCSTEIW